MTGYELMILSDQSWKYTIDDINGVEGFTSSNILLIISMVLKCSQAAIYYWYQWCWRVHKQQENENLGISKWCLAFSVWDWNRCFRGSSFLSHMIPGGGGGGGGCHDVCEYVSFLIIVFSYIQKDNLAILKWWLLLSEVGNEIVIF